MTLAEVAVLESRERVARLVSRKRREWGDSHVYCAGCWWFYPRHGFIVLNMGARVANLQFFHDSVLRCPVCGTQLRRSRHDKSKRKEYA